MNLPSGGVLIAIRLDLKAEYKNTSVRKGAEIKPIEVTIGEIFFCSVYRVETLGEDHYQCFSNTVEGFHKLIKLGIQGNFILLVI